MSQVREIEEMMEVAKKEITRLNSYGDGGSGGAEIAVKEWKVYLLILNAIVNPKSKKGIFAILLAKFDEALRDSMEMREKLVTENILEEAYYLCYCESMVSVRKNTIIMVNARIAADDLDMFCEWFQ
jgi:hypothetical protein